MFDFRGQGKRLALAAMLFGISATAQAGESRLLYASLGDTTRAPIGWVEFCADNTAQCQGAPTTGQDPSRAARRQPSVASTLLNVYTCSPMTSAAGSAMSGASLFIRSFGR